MSNKRTHDWVGFGLGAVTALVTARMQGREPSIWEIAGGGLGGLGGSRGPDLLEPADHPHHRQFAHSATILALGGAGVFPRALAVQADLARSAAAESDPVLRALTQIAGGISVGLPAGYASHLLADATARKRSARYLNV